MNTNLRLQNMEKRMLPALSVSDFVHSEIPSATVKRGDSLLVASDALSLLSELKKIEAAGDEIPKAELDRLEALVAKCS